MPRRRSGPRRRSRAWREAAADRPAASAASPAAPAGGPGLRLLLDAFPMLDSSAVASVFRACGRDTDAAAGYLVGMVPAPPVEVREPGGTWADAAAAAGAGGDAPPRRRDPLGELPLDTLVMVVEMLGVFDQSRLARASRQCRSLVREAFGRVKFLSFQPYWEDWRVLGMLQSFPAVESVLLRVPHFSSFAQLASCAPRLVKVGAAGCKNLDDDAVQHLTSFLPGLREINLARTAVTDASLHHLAEHGGLEFVSLEGCPYVTARGAGRMLARLGARLHFVDLSRTAASADTLAPIELLDSALQRLQLKRCKALREVRLASATSPLTSLNVTSCASLERVSLSLPALEHLNVSNCKRVRELTLRCPSLTDLNLAGCSALESLVVEQAGSLERVNLFQCKGVRSGDFRAMAEAAGNSLRSVNASGLILLNASAVERMLEVCEGLEELDLAGCRRLEQADVRQAARAIQVRTGAGVGGAKRTK